MFEKFSQPNNDEGDPRERFEEVYEYTPPDDDAREELRRALREEGLDLKEKESE